MRELIARGRSLDELWAVANGSSHADKYADFIHKHLRITVGGAGGCVHGGGIEGWFRNYCALVIVIVDAVLYAEIQFYID